MDGLKEKIDLSAILREIITPLPVNPRDLDLEPVYGSYSSRMRVAEALVAVLEPLKPNFLMGFRNHLSPVSLTSTILGIDYEIAYKRWSDETPRRLLGVVVNEQRLQKALGKLSEPPRIVFMDNYLETGIVGGLAIDSVRRAVSEEALQHAVFLTAVATGGGNEALREKRVESHILTMYSPENGFSSNIMPEVSSAIGGSSRRNFVGYEIGRSSSETRPHHKTFCQIPNRPTLGITKAHEHRPGGHSGF